MAFKTKPLSRDELLALDTVVDLATAGRAFGLGYTKARQLVATGKFPVAPLKLGNSYRFPTERILEVLGVQRDEPEPSTADSR